VRCSHEQLCKNFLNPDNGNVDDLSTDATDETVKVTGNFKKFFGGEESLRPTMLSKTKLVDGLLDDTVNNNIAACHHRWHTCRLSGTHLYFPALREGETPTQYVHGHLYYPGFIQYCFIQKDYDGSEDCVINYKNKILFSHSLMMSCLRQVMDGRSNYSYFWGENLKQVFCYKLL
jgi:hypothetical protein